MEGGSGLSLSKERALAICPKISSAISIPCSCYIIYEVFHDHRTRGTSPVQRALAAMSCVDIMASSAWFLSTWAVPASSGFAYASGNRTSCNFQGFLLQLAIGAPLYNSSLALFYLLMIKMRWSNLQLAKIERWVHIFIMSFTWGTSILLLQLEQYNHIAAVCWVIGEPVACGSSTYQGNDDVPCNRGKNAWAWGVFLFYGPLWVCVIGCTYSMVVLYLHVRKTHAKSRSYTRAIRGMRHSANRSGADTSKVAHQAILYSLTFLITWMPSTLWSVSTWFNWSAYGLDLAAAIAEPLQGLWNFLIFLKSRPRTRIRIRQALHKVFPWVNPLPPSRRNSSHQGSSLREGSGNVDSRSYSVMSTLMNIKIWRSSANISSELGSTMNSKQWMVKKSEEDTSIRPFGDGPERSKVDVIDDGEDDIDGPACDEIEEAILHNIPLSNIFEMSDSSSNGSVGEASFLKEADDADNTEIGTNADDKEEESDGTNEAKNIEQSTDFDTCSPQNPATAIGPDSPSALGSEHAEVQKIHSRMGAEDCRGCDSSKLPRGTIEETNFSASSDVGNLKIENLEDSGNSFDSASSLASDDPIIGEMLAKPKKALLN